MGLKSGARLAGRVEPLHRIPLRVRVLLFAMRGMRRGVRAEVIEDRIRAGIRSMLDGGLAEAQRELFGVFDRDSSHSRRYLGRKARATESRKMRKIETLCYSIMNFAHRLRARAIVRLFRYRHEPFAISRCIIEISQAAVSRANAWIQNGNGNWLNEITPASGSRVDGQEGACRNDEPLLPRRGCIEETYPGLLPRFLNVMQYDSQRNYPSYPDNSREGALGNTSRIRMESSFHKKFASFGTRGLPTDIRAYRKRG